MSAQPTGWSEAALGDVCRIVSGATPKTGVTKYWGGEIPWLTPNDMSRDRSQTLTGGERYLTELGYDSCSARLFPAGSVIVSSRAPVGYVAIAGREMCTNQGCKTAVPPDFIDSRYLYWYLLAAKPDLEARASGTTFKEISSKRFAETRLVWPDLAEQRRIVEILEDHLSRLDAADQYVTDSLRRQAAFSTARLQQLIWKQPFELTTVAEVLREPMRNGRSDRASDAPNAIRTLTLTAVTRGDFGEHNTKLTSTSAEVARGLWLEPGDVFVQRSNTPELVGSSARYDGPTSWAIFPDLLIRLRPDESRMDSRFLAAALRSARAHRSLRSRARGLAGSMPKVDQRAVGETVIPLPPRDRQDEIVAHLNEMQDAGARMRDASVSALRRSAALRRAVLAVAFEGKLTGRHADDDVMEEAASLEGATR